MNFNFLFGSIIVLGTIISVIYNTKKAILAKEKKSRLKIVQNQYNRQ